MATRKQKHAAALERREKYMAAWRAEGLAALEADRKRRKEKKDQQDEALAVKIRMSLAPNKMKIIAAGMKQVVDTVNQLSEFVKANEEVFKNKLTPVFSE